MKTNKHLVKDHEYQLTKAAIEAVTSIGVGRIVSCAVRSVVPVSELNLPMKVAVVTAQVGISGVIANAATKNHVDILNEFVGTYRAIKAEATEDDVKE